VLSIIYMTYNPLTFIVAKWVFAGIVKDLISTTHIIGEQGGVLSVIKS